MKKSKVEALFPLINSKVTGYRGEWVLGHCPFAPWTHVGGDSHPSFAISAFDNKKSIFKCFSCNRGGDLLHLQSLLTEQLHKAKLPGYQMGKALELVSDEFTDMEFDKDLPDYGDHTETVDCPFPEPWLASFASYSAFPHAVGYLTKRTVSAALADKFSLRYDPVQNRICFPYRNRKGQLIGLQGRYAADKVPSNVLRYRFYKCLGNLNMQAWMGEDTMDLDKPLVLCEGPFDLIKIAEAYPNVVASFTSGLSQHKLDRIADASEIVTFYDAGQGGDQARLAVKKYFAKLKTPVVHVIPQNDGGDPGSQSLDEVVWHLKSHVKLK